MDGVVTSLEFPEVPNSEDDTRDWSYTMRRNMQEILPNVFLGPYSVATKRNLSNLLELGITHVVCVRDTLEAKIIKPNFSDHFRYLVLDVADKTTENIIQHFPKVKEFMDQCLQTGGKVLVHGNGGISRSAALVIAYMMETYGMTYRDAFHHVQQRRFCIQPNEGFANQLMEYEPIYMARLTVRPGTCWGQNNTHLHGGRKRSLDEEGDEEAMDQTGDPSLDSQNKSHHPDT
ncbi:PREDICTED: serine/threonine/tyrosine-interacting protein A-like [Branchiostoma belcheri]|uniref:Serine/threonine/tyrosine-interacting protein A-like n=1 Tax=Branchiostoma belcheri TaxID=7741 RepID=A0A6P4Z3H9_BRABE|nr:PREDICTED: serine/threonine/tyrosine-interacting protein A-like [Branchiostoma belcheri]